MPFFHLRPAPPIGWSEIPDPAANPVWLAYQQLQRTEWLEPAEIERMQLAQVRHLLTHCVQHVPYYNRLLAEAGIVPQRIQTIADFRCLPLLTRQQYQLHFSELTARQLPPGTIAAGEAFTSGTNGVPIRVLQTNIVNLWWYALYLRDLEWCGIDPRGRLAAIRMIVTPPPEAKKTPEGFVLPHWDRFLNTFIETGKSYGMDIHQDQRRQLDWLRKIETDYLLSLPSNLEHLAGLIAASGRPLSGLKAIQAVGETVTDETRERIETAFGVPLKNTYSNTEAGCLASPCPQGHGLHVHAENALVEVLDENDRRCLPGQTGRLVFTTLLNYLAPFIRYDIVDDATLGPGRCPCGRGLPLLTQIFGRRHPLLHLPDGRRKIFTRLCMEVRKAGGAHQFQIVQRAVDHVIVRIVPNQDWNAGRAEQIRKAVHDHFEAPIRVDVDVRDRLELPPSGKLRVGINEIEERLAAT